MVPDGRGGVFLVKSTYDDNRYIRTRVYHVDSLGQSIWSVGQVFLPNYPTLAAFNDGSGGIVLILSEYDRAARFDYQGNSLWLGQPITTIGDPQNLGPIRSDGDWRGGAIIPFWSLSGGIKAQHTGRDGAVGIITRVVEQNAFPIAIELAQNYPNPFNAITQIEFHITERDFVTLKVYDVLGRETATLVNAVLQPGSYKMSWDGSGNASGIYLCQLQLGNRNIVRKMILLQ
jgi:hypothetical protein